MYFFFFHRILLTWKAALRQPTNTYPIALTFRRDYFLGV